MATPATRSHLLLAAVTLLTLAALCAIGLAIFQVAAIEADVTRILSNPPAGVPAQDPGSADTPNDRNKEISARSAKDWKWIVGYSNPPRIRHAEVQAITAKIATVQRNMVLAFALVAVAAALLALLVSRVARCIRGNAAKLASDLQEVSALTSVASGTARGAATNPVATMGPVDQALHAAWDHLPGESAPAPDAAPQTRPAAQPGTASQDGTE